MLEDILAPIPRFRPSLGLGEAVRALLDDSGGADPHALFAERFARFIGVRHAVWAPSMRQGLAAVLRGLRLPDGGEVLMPSLTFHSVPTAFLRAGLTVRFVDIDPHTYCMDADAIEGAVGPKTVAIAPVHLYGRASPMEVIGDVASRHGLRVIEDCAQSAGAEVAGRPLGSWGDAGVFSFHGAKNLSALWAGMVTTDDDELADAVQEYVAELPRVGLVDASKRWLEAAGMDLITSRPVWTAAMAPTLRLCARAGFDPVTWLASEAPGESTSNLDGQAHYLPRPVQARVALRQLAGLKDANNRRRRNGEHLRERLARADGIGLPAPSVGLENIYLSFVITADDRDALRRRLLRRGVDTHPGNMFSGPTLPGLEGCGEGARAADAIARMIHVPVYPQMTVEDVDRVADALLEESTT